MKIISDDDGIYTVEHCKDNINVQTKKSLIQKIKEVFKNDK